MADYFINAITRRVVFSGSAGVGPYAFTFEVLDENDVAVYKDSTKLTLTTDYTVTVNVNGTGSVTLVSAATSANTITILGARDIERVTDFVTAGDLRASAINEQLDALTIFDQQLAEEQKRTLMAPPYDPAHVDDGGTLNMTLPAAAVRANSFLIFDAAGNPSVQASGSTGAPTSITRQQFSGDGSTVAFTLASDPGAAGNSLSVYISGVYQQRATYTVAGTTLTFSAAPPSGTNNIEVVNYTVGAIGTTDASLVTYNQGSAGSVSRTVENKLQETVSVTDFGAIGDGVADDTAAIQAAIDSLGKNGGAVYLPAGTYNVSSTINIKENGITFFGDNSGTGSYFIGTIPGDVQPPAPASRLNYVGAGNQAILAVGVVGTWESDGLLTDSRTRTCIAVRDIGLYGGDSDANGLGVVGLFVRHGVINSTFSDIFTQRCKYGIHLLGRDDVQSFNNRFYRCHVEHFTHYGIYIEGDGNGTIISGCKIQNSASVGATPTASICIASDSASTEGSKANTVVIENNSFGSANILHHIKTYAVNGLMISGNEIEASGNSTRTAWSLVHLGDATSGDVVNGFTIIGNRFLGNSKAQRPISVQNAEGGVICGNSFGSAGYTLASVIASQTVDGNYDVSVFGNWLPSGLSIASNKDSLSLVFNEDLNTYTLTSVSADRSFNPSTATTTELGNVLGTLIKDLALKRVINWQ